VRIILTVRTAHQSVLMIVHNCRIQYSTEQFWFVLYCIRHTPVTDRYRWCSNCSLRKMCF